MYHITNECVSACASACMMMRKVRALFVGLNYLINDVAMTATEGEDCLPAPVCRVLLIQEKDGTLKKSTRDLDSFIKVLIHH